MAKTKSSLKALLDSHSSEEIQALFSENVLDAIDEKENVVGVHTMKLYVELKRAVREPIEAFCREVVPIDQEIYQTLVSDLGIEDRISAAEVFLHVVGARVDAEVERALQDVKTKIASDLDSPGST